MKNPTFKKLVPHLIAIGIFLLVAVIFCKPALEHDVVLKQGDVSSWQGMSHQSYLYKEHHGHVPLWLTSMFSGMPAYQVALEGSWSPLGYIDGTFQLWLPQPLNFFFLACISFYFLCICLRIRPYIAILGALAYAYCSFSPIIITAGHNTQMLALGYAPAVIGAVILIFDKKYFLGFALATLFTALQIAQSHQQISYYLFLVLAIMTISYSIQFIRSKQTDHLLKSIGLMAIAALIGIAVNAIILLTTYDYAKDSKRGGQLVMDGTSNNKDKVADGKTKGLSKDYAFQWSYGRSELLSLMFPGVQGYGNHQAERDGDVYQFPILDENANAVKYLSETFGAGDQAVSYASSNIYWGKQPFTNGPVYLGAVMCFLFILSMFYLDNRHKWWIFAGSMLGLLLSLGNNLPAFNYFMFDYFPLYNKFRVPTMALVMPQLLFPIGAALVINKIANRDDQDAWKKFKYGLIATGIVFIIAIGFYATSDFTNENKLRTNKFNELYNAKDPLLQQKLGALDENYKPERDNQVYEGMVANFKGDPSAPKASRDFLRALEKDRASLLLSDIMRSFFYVLIAAALIFFYMKNKINMMIMVAGITLTSLIDQLSFGMKYLNDKSFDSKEKYESSEFPMTNADKMILADKDPNYRVFNTTTGLDESKTSYYHKSIGGYHPAKLGIYDDLMAHQLNGSPNLAVINMLNTKYIIQQQGNEVVASLNPGALGNAWFVDAVKYVKGPVEEMKALNNFSPKDTAIVDESYKLKVTAFTPADSSDIIRIKTFDNDAITYESSAAGNRLAVFSEIFYKDWKVTVDGKGSDYFKANYVLRAMIVPAGKHTIEFKFEPSVFYLGKNISNISVWLLMLILISCIVYYIRKNKTTEEYP
ncbi:MAG: YfhO family protein [Ferruginibacter sp.]